MKSLIRLVVILTFFLVSELVSADPYHDVTSGHPKEISPAYFGVHFHRLLVQPAEHAVRTQWPEIAFGTVRLWDSGTSWQDIAPHAGSWQFDRMDTWVDTTVAHQATVLYVLGSTPRWASARPDEPCPYGLGCAAEAIRIEHWEEYVRRVAQRYGTRIGAYELWNEPNFSDYARDRGAHGFYTGSIAKMVEMARAARKVLDVYSPNAKLCTPGFTNGPDRLESFLAAGGNQYVQAVCYHFYSDSTDDFVRNVKEVRAIMQRTGVASLPLWNTETGVERPANVDPTSGVIPTTRDDSIARLAQMLILGAASGMEHFYYYAWDNDRSGMVTRNGDSLPGYQALQRLQSWLLGSRLTGCSSRADVVQCDGTRGTERYLVMWAAKDAMRTVNAPLGWTIAGVDPLLGGTSSLASANNSGALSFALGPVPVRVRIVRATGR
ncbi:hypothetical protein RCH09_003569 [Actimicrobium sp. GrIS 1.19]|uniref:glycosyl hydrolase n=1 Tax=Actimicrobium sp. GrIS 1.19 TaxID=3071708 RepID=UPI002DFE4922|nr:hypothetical protein [Actimicrobium sp. GrIS 1.19]